MNALTEDASVDSLAPARREAVSEIWLGRAQGELSTAAVFDEVAQAARELSASPAVVSLIARACHDEMRHAQLCHELAELYAGRTLACANAAAFEAPRFGDAPEEVNRHLLLVYQSCLNEGIAAAYLQENQRLARASAAREVIHALLCDDLVHARIGWAHLASPMVSADARRHIAAALPALLRLARKVWLGPGLGPDLDCPEHGCLGRFRHLPIVSAAIEELILPGFAHLGFTVGA